MSVDTRASNFFVAGGTLRLDAPSYVKRREDDELLDLALTGEFCYVLTPRQMGKSSLMVQAVRRLQERGVRTAIIDLTSIGTDASVEQWYLGLITRLTSQLRLRVDPEAWWVARASLGVVQRFTDFLHDVVFVEIGGPVVVFIDEIDTTLNLGFSDDFFAAIRSTYNARASDPAYNRLTFVLLGVAAPADLIKDPNRTPFNIGHRVDLHEFSQEDAGILQQGLEAVFPKQGQTIFARIYHWTNGHPYLTQKLCLAATEAGNGRWADERVDGLVERLFLAKEARKEGNLQFVRSKVLDHPQARQLLVLYRKVCRGKRIADDERSPVQNQLKLSGLVQVKGGYLSARNRVYERAFDLTWVRENTPGKSIQIVASILGIVALAVGLIIYDREFTSGPALSVEIVVPLPEGCQYVQTYHLDVNSDGNEEWIIMCYFDQASPPGAQQHGNPIAAYIYQPDDSKPPNTLAYELRVPGDDYLCECRCVPTMNDALSELPGPELVLGDTCDGERMRLTIFQWDRTKPAYLPVGHFLGHYISITSDTVIVEELQVTRAQLAIRQTYHPAGGQTYYLDNQGTLVPPAEQEIVFSHGEPEDVTLSPYPEKVVLAFYNHYTDTAKIRAYFADGAWDGLGQCDTGQCGCTAPRSEITHVRVTSLQYTEDPTDPNRTTVEVTVVCEYPDGTPGNDRFVQWHLIHTADRWQLDSVE